MNAPIYLHFSNLSSAGIAVTIATIFALIFVISFAFRPAQLGDHHFSREWTWAWLKSWLPRMVVAAAFSAAVFVASSLVTGSFNHDSQAGIDPQARASAPPGTCDKALSAVTNNLVTAQRIEFAVKQLQLVAAYAQNHDFEGAQAIFYGDAHNLSHDIDKTLWDANLELGKALCQSIFNIEFQRLTYQELSQEAMHCATLLTQAETALGLTPSASSGPAQPSP